MTTDQLGDALGISKMRTRFYVYGNGRMRDIGVLVRIVKLLEVDPITLSLVWRQIPPGLTPGDVTDFFRACRRENLTPATVLAQLVKGFTENVRGRG